MPDSAYIARARDALNALPSPAQALSIGLGVLASVAFSQSDTVKQRTQHKYEAAAPVLPGPRLWPEPTSMSSGSDVICLADTFTVNFKQGPFIGRRPPKDLVRAADDMQKRMWASRHTYLSPTGGREFFPRHANATDASGLGPCTRHVDTLVLSLTGSVDPPCNLSSIADFATAPVEDRPDHEAYRLVLPLDGPARISSKTALGLYRGLTTFEHLFYHLADAGQAGSGSAVTPARPSSTAAAIASILSGQPGSETGLQQDGGTPSASQTETGRVYVPFAPYDIEDRPAFGWRAVLLDTSRHYFGVDALLKMIDTMAMVKLNVFHWHITDSQSWPLDLAEFPELADRGAYSPAQKYSEADIRRIIDYAAERGVDTVMEIDIPGHSAIIAESHPEHIACYLGDWTRYANEPPAGQLRFANAETSEFTRRLISAAAGVSARSEYFSLGGDELNKNCMMDDAQTVAELRANGWTLDQALDNFVGKVYPAITGVGKTPVVWQEMVLEHGLLANLPPTSVVDIWKSSTDARAVIDQGYKIVHAPSDYFYLDCGTGGWIGQDGGGNSWCDPFKSWARMYSFDPYKDLGEAQKAQVLGGQACLWAEQTDETNLEPLMWPRAAAVAELFWSGAGSTGFPKSSMAALPRMHDIRYRMVDHGVRATPLQPHWCATHPGKCNLGPQ